MPDSDDNYPERADYIGLMDLCPFCGGHDLEIVFCDIDCCGGKPRWIQCNCGAELGGSWNTLEEAIAAWNHRPTSRPNSHS